MLTLVVRVVAGVAVGEFVSRLGFGWVVVRLGKVKLDGFGRGVGVGSRTVARSVGCLVSVVGWFAFRLRCWRWSDCCSCCCRWYKCRHSKLRCTSRSGRWRSWYNTNLITCWSCLSCLWWCCNLCSSQLSWCSVCSWYGVGYGVGCWI